MRVIDVAPRDIYVTFEISIAEIYIMKNLLTSPFMKYGTESNNKLREAVEYIQSENGFLAVIEKLLKDLEESDGT